MLVSASIGSRDAIFLYFLKPAPVRGAWFALSPRADFFAGSPADEQVAWEEGAEAGEGEEWEGPEEWEEAEERERFAVLYGEAEPEEWMDGERADEGEAFGDG